MRVTTALLLVTGWAVCLVLASCGRSHSGAGSPASNAQPPDLSASLPPGLAFPALSTLPHVASGPPSDGNRFSVGYYCASGWPLNKVDTGGLSGDFSPAWDPAAPDLSKAAYCTYALYNMGSYAGKKRIHLTWQGGAPPPAKVFVGIANVTHDRWDWLGVNALQDAYFSADYSDYIDTGEGMHIIVVLLDNKGYSLSGVCAGDSFFQGPGMFTDLNSDVTQNIAPLTVTFTAYGTSAGSYITGYDWDLDNDGVFEVLHQDKVTRTFAPGLYTVTVRGTDGEGASNTFSRTFTAVNPDNQPPVASFTTADPTSGPAPLHIHFDASGSSDPDGTITTYDWDFNADGLTDFSSPTPQADYVFAQKGAVQVLLTVTDNDFAQDIHPLPLSITSGWASQVIDSSVELPGIFDGTRGLAMAGFGVQPATGVAYRDLLTDKLRFVAGSATGNGWQAPVNPVSGSGTGYSPGIVGLASGIPLLSFGVQSNDVYAQYVVSATDDTAAAWNAPVLVAGGTDMGFDTSVALVNSLPALAGSSGSNFQPALTYVAASDPLGLTWGAPITVMDNTGEPRAASLWTCGSGPAYNPAVVCTTLGAGGARYMTYAFAIDAGGGTWSAPIQFGNYCYYASLLSVAGHPAWVGGLHSGTNADIGLQYCRATDPLGSLAAWPAPRQIATGGDAQLLSWNGAPAVVFVDQPHPYVQLVVAQDAAGSAWDAPYVVANGPGLKVARAAVVSGNLVIVYYNDNLHKLYAAHWNP